MTNNVLQVFLMLCVCSTTVFTNEIRCYDCDPSQQGQCLTPKEADTINKPCTKDNSESRSYFKKQLEDAEKTEIDPKATEEVFECYSIYADTDSDEGRGVYRGCLWKDVTTFSACDQLKDIFNNRTLISCRTCADMSLCNDDKVAGGAGVSAGVSLALLLINAIVCLFVIQE